MSNDDIVARLRAVLHNDRSVELMNREAADQIEGLREELTASHESHGNEVGALTERLALAIHERDAARQERDAVTGYLEAADDVRIRCVAAIRAERDEARHGEAVATATLYGMIEERTALRAERDEARREVCVLMQRTGFLRGDYAAERNWDCFDRTVNGIDANEIRVDLAGGTQ